ncbi:hypothetical protein CP369_10380, partial [Lactobacillus sp. UMNPBX18]
LVSIIYLSPVANLFLKFRIITFVWSFIFVYTVEKVMPFILDGRLNLASWSGVTKFCSVIAFIGGNPCFYWNLFSL